MTSFKQDLQKKIQNYQSILKKTYEQSSNQMSDRKPEAKGSEQRASQRVNTEESLTRR